jgi:thiol-disulfide isomerase/thioredoxin
MSPTRKQKKHNTVDVRDPSQVSMLEETIKKGPITFILIYADWCGYCKKFKQEVWSKLLALEHIVANLASIHHDQLEHTSMRGAKFSGYPSVIVVGPDGIPATFDNGQNSMPNINDLVAMKRMVKQPVNETPEYTPAAKTARAKINREMTAPVIRGDYIGTAAGGGIKSEGSLFKTLFQMSHKKSRNSTRKYKK